MKHGQERQLHTKHQMTNKKIKAQKNQIQKEESIREILGFFINSIEVSKYIHHNKKQNYDGIQDYEEKIQDEFLNQNEFAEIKGSYDDYNIGDLTIVFQNPDYEDNINKPVSFKEAEKVFDEILTVMADESVSKVQQKKEKDAFLLSFLTLNDYKDQEKQKKNKNNKKRTQQQITIAKQQRMTTNNSLRKSQDDNPLKQRKHKKEKNSFQKYLEFISLYNKYEEEKLMEEEQEHLLNNNKQEKHGQGYLDDINVEMEKKEQNPISAMDPLKELLKVDITNSRQFKKVKKSWSKGQYLKKKFVDKEDYEWVCSNGQPKDFLTLIRFTLIAKLSRNGCLHCRTFVSMTGIYIFLVIKSNEQVIMRQAQNMKITKQIELGYADLFSLEPVDETFRPLRLKNYVRQITDEQTRSRLQAINESNKEGQYGTYQSGLVEDHCQALYPKVCQWNDLDLRVQIIRKQTETDRIMNIIAKQLNIDMNHEKVEIIHDTQVSREHWEAYYIYMEYIVCYGQIIQNLVSKGHKQIKENMAFIYKLIFRKALGDANEFWYDRHFSIWKEITQQKSILKNLWGQLDVESVAPYADFFIPLNEQGCAMWRKYEVNEIGLRSEFINMEKIKITNSIVLKNINILKMIQEQMAFAYFPIHDHYQLRGISKEPFFQTVKEAGFMNLFEESVGQIEMKRLFSQLKDEAEPTDFDSSCLEKESAFMYNIPWAIPITNIRDYFGEKIALYFSFLSYYTKQLWYMAVIGIITQGLMSSDNQNVRSTVIIMFAIIIIIWSTFFIEFWKRQQKLFSVQYGQQNFEEDEAERPAFKGQYIRSITNDDLNLIFYSPFRRKMKQLFSLAVSFLIIGCVIACVLGIFAFKSNLIEQQQPQTTIIAVPAILNSIQIGFFNVIYSILVMIFNKFENHKILSSYENALIAKVFIFMFVNNFNSFFIIAFLEGYFQNLNLCSQGDIGEKNCFGVLESQMLIIFLSTVGKNIPELLLPIIKAMLHKRTRQIDEKPVIHAFNLIDNAIEDQLELEPYQTNEEVDGTVNDYMELVIQFSYLCLFGLAFPSAYILAFFANILEIQVDKLKLIRFERRPFPQGAATIGNWLVIIEVITFFGIFSNAGLIAYTSTTIQSNQLVAFTSLLILFLALKFFIRFMVPDEPESAMILNRRHQYVVDRVIKGFGTTKYKTYIPHKLDFQIGRVEYDNNENHENQQVIEQEVESIKKIDEQHYSSDIQSQH